MSVGQQNGQIREAVLEFKRYLSGDVSPLTATDSFDALVGQPAELAARVIADWVQAQFSGVGRSVPVSDYVFHALKKVHLLAEFDLVAKEPLMRYLQALSRILVEICPEGERAALKLKLSRIGEAETAAVTSRVEFLHRAGGAGGEKVGDLPAQGLTEGVSRRLELLLERLTEKHESAGPGSGGGTGKGIDETLLAQVLSTAALQAKTSAELSGSLAQLQSAGVGAQLGEMFKALGRSLPGWMVPAPASSEDGPLVPAAKPIEAMEKIVSLAPDAQEGAKRLGEMIYAAIEQFNEGRLAQAVAMFDAARRLIEEKKPEAAMLKMTLVQAQTTLSDAVLKRVTESPDKHGLLRRVLDFFPAYRARALLEELHGEERRDRRKLLLALLEVHGGIARDLIIARLAATAGGEVPDQEGFYARNLLFLLRRIPREADDATLDQELGLLSRMIQPGVPVMAVNEAVGAFGQIRHAAAEQALIDRLKALEGELTNAGVEAGDDARDLFDRLCAALARQGTPDALRSVAAHAFSKNPAFGDTMSRFEHLSRQDLSADPEQLAALVRTIRDQLPSKMLSFVKKKALQDVYWLIQAVSGTPTPEVREVVQEVSRRFDGSPLGDEAAKALAKLEPRAKIAPAAEALSGDLELFGLPNLLQSLADTQANGELTLFDRSQTRRASLALAKGRLARCDTGPLNGDDAMYQLLELPFPGTFVFRAAATPAPADGGRELLGMMLEGLRRNDELGPARALVPDGLMLEATGEPAQTPEDETDAELVRAVWAQASQGVPAEVCEAAAKVDSFRVRRLYAHWVEQGALQPRVSPSPPR